MNINGGYKVKSFNKRASRTIARVRDELSDSLIIDFQDLWYVLLRYVLINLMDILI